MDRSAWIEHARGRLAAEGCRAGGARQAVLEQLAEQTCCTSAQQIFDRLRERDRRIGLASVYRALDLLAGLGLVHRLDIDGVAAYEPADPSGEHHHHLVCGSCGRVDRFEDPALEEAIGALTERLGYRVAEHDVVLRGACGRCAA